MTHSTAFALSERRIAVQEAQEALRMEHAKMVIEATGAFYGVEVSQWLRINDVDVYKFIETETPLLPARWAMCPPDDDVQVFMTLDDLAEEL